jgi:TorA maturation chaperone TorD
VGELLQELGAILLVPGLGLEPGARPLVASPDLQPALDDAIRKVLESPAEQLEIAYAGLFMHGYDHPTLHLEESVMRCGELRNEAVMGDLNEIYLAAELEILAPFEADHLGAMVSLLGHLLQRMDERQRPIEPELQEAASRLLAAHLKPLLGHVSEQLALRNAHPFYGRVADLLGVALHAAEELLQIPEPRHLDARET